MAYSKEVIDSIGKSYPRKNQYIIDLINASPADKKKIDKKTHPYMVKLNKFKEKEKEFLSEIDKEAKEKYANVEVAKIRKLEEKLYKAYKKEAFYDKYIDLTYDARLSHDISKREIMHIPEIIKSDKNLRQTLESRKQELANITQSDIDKAKKEIEIKTKNRNNILEKELDDLNHKYKEGLISKKALKTERKAKKRAAKEDITSYSYLNRKKAIEEDIKNINHHLKIDYKSKMNVLNSDISDIRRKTPQEVEKTIPIISYLTFLIPGLGQLLNKQYAKAILFGIATLFIYFAAIPYFLGYGNYQGTGFSGLFTLAEGGKRLDRSIIFMIEGVISIMMILIAVFLLYISFKDVNKVEKNMIKGIRKRSWFETKDAITNEGFPYLVITPAAIVVLFIVLVPIFTTILISFTNYDPNHQAKFQWFGISNYKLLFAGQGVAGKAFWPIVIWTIIWTIFATSLAIFIGFALSIIANNDRIKFKGVFRTIYLLPWAVPAFITIMFFSQMFARGGPIPQLVSDIFGVTLDVKNNPMQTRIVLILLQGWLGSAYVFLLSTGILQGIPSDLYEAAEIDGATGFKKTWNITIPLVLYQTAPLLIGQYTFNFNNFSIIHLFNGGGPFNPSVYGNVAGSTDLLISYIYKLTINSNYQGMGAAVTVVISLVLMFFTWLGFKDMKAFKEN